MEKDANNEIRERNGRWGGMTNNPVFGREQRKQGGKKKKRGEEGTQYKVGRNDQLSHDYNMNQKI